MKRFLSFMIALLCGVCMVVSLAHNFSYATNDEKTYLLSPTFNAEPDYVAAYNIGANEVNTSVKPVESGELLAGASVRPATSAEQHQTFNKTITMRDSVAITEEQSIFVYVLFAGDYTHNLQIVANGTDTITWDISKETIASETNAEDDSKVRYGWLKIELPSSKNFEISSLNFVYNQTSIVEEQEYAAMYFYAPYVAAKTNSTISFVNKIRYYNFSQNFGNYQYTGDTFAFDNMEGILTYCYIGDIDYIAAKPNNYYFVVRVINLDNQSKNSKTLDSADFSFEHTFAVAANYQIDLTLYNSDNSPLWMNSAQFMIRDFVGIYVSTGLADMRVGQTFGYELVISPDLVGAHGVSATSSNEKAATVAVDNGVLKVAAKAKGRTVINLSVTGQYKGETKTFSTSYVININQFSTVNWWLMGGVAIFLIIAGIIVYTIMVRRRLIKGKYPKY